MGIVLKRICEKAVLWVPAVLFLAGLCLMLWVAFFSDDPGLDYIMQTREEIMENQQGIKAKQESMEEKLNKLEDGVNRLEQNLAKLKYGSMQGLAEIKTAMAGIRSDNEEIRKLNATDLDARLRILIREYGLERPDNPD